MNTLAVVLLAMPGILQEAVNTLAVLRLGAVKVALVNDWIPGNGFASMVALTLVKGLPAVIAVWLVWRVASRTESRHLRALADHFVPERELIRNDERRRLGAPLRRLAVRRQLARRFGRRAGRLKGRLQRKQLVLVLLAGERGRGAHTRRLEHAIRLLRMELDWLCSRSLPSDKPAAMA